MSGGPAVPPAARVAPACAHGGPACDRAPKEPRTDRARARTPARRDNFAVQGGNRAMDSIACAPRASFVRGGCRFGLVRRARALLAGGAHGPCVVAMALATACG